MRFKIQPSILTGKITPPGSKSHTIRSFILATLAEGTSAITNPLLSNDGIAPITACQELGGTFQWNEEKTEVTVTGTASELRMPRNTLDVGNSGTTLYFLTSICSLLKGKSVLTGDHSIQSRPIGYLLEALQTLGAKSKSLSKPNFPPIQVEGPLQGGVTKVAGVTSQYTSSLLLSCPLAINDSIIEPVDLQEKPYVLMTLNYLKNTGIQVTYDESYSRFTVNGNQSYKKFQKEIPSDFSSAAFLIGAGVLAGQDLTITNLDFTDDQADKKFVEILEKMGAEVKKTSTSLTISQSCLHSMDIDLSQSPDLLPIMAVVATQAQGTTVIHNVKHARIKETDRIKVISEELRKMGATIEEREDGLLIKESKLQGTVVDGHHDHRIVMALSVAGLVASGRTTVLTAESANITYPNFTKDFQKLSGNIQIKI